MIHGMDNIQSATYGTASWPNTEVAITALLGCFVIPPMVPGILFKPAWDFANINLLLNIHSAVVCRHHPSDTSDFGSDHHLPSVQHFRCLSVASTSAQALLQSCRQARRRCCNTTYSHSDCCCTRDALLLCLYKFMIRLHIVSKLLGLALLLLAWFLEGLDSC